jgi:hypothetical protein
MKRKRFTKEFKLEALRLLEQVDKPAAVLARELGEYYLQSHTTPIGTDLLLLYLCQPLLVGEKYYIGFQSH